MKFLRACDKFEGVEEPRRREDAKTDAKRANDCAKAAKKPRESSDNIDFLAHLASWRSWRNFLGISFASLFASSRLRGSLLPQNVSSTLIRSAGITLFVIISAAIVKAEVPATVPTTQATDPKLWTEMTAVDAKAATITDITAEFVQQKFTPLLKKPLVSSGSLRVRGDVALWITDKPQPTKMLVNAKEIQIDYPQQLTMEIYPLEGQLAALASSPLPRLDVLRRYFSFERLFPASLNPAANDEQYLALKMTPIDPKLREHIQEVDVLLDRRNGIIIQATNIDTDNEKTILTFTNILINKGVSDADLKLDVSPGTKVVHPLEGMTADHQDGAK
jgi:hypothetical protein